MRVIFVTYCRVMLGANKSLLYLIKDLRSRYQVKPLVIIPEVVDGTLEDVLKKENIPYVISKTKPWVVSETARYKLLRGIKAALCNRKYVNDLQKQLESQKYDMVYSNNSTIQLGADLARKMKIPHVWHVREYGKKDYQIQFSYPKPWVRRKFQAASAVITISKDLDAYVKTEISQKIHTVQIYNGIEIKADAEKKKKKKNSSFKFVCVGALQEGKNQLELLQAAKLLKDAGIEGFEIHIIGDGDIYKKRLLEYCEEYKLQNIVAFHGYLENVSDILSDMDAGIICSKSEAFGRVTVEYMLSKLPVIGAFSAGTAEIVEHNKTGYLYHLGNTRELMECMCALLENREMSMEMGENGYLRATTLFDAKRNTDQIYHLMQETLAENKKRK